MVNEHAHVSDEDLALAADDELEPARADEVRAHLALCPACHSRGQAIADTMSTFAQGYRRELDEHVPPGDGPRARLRARLQDLSTTGAAVNRRWPSVLQRWLPPAAAAVVLLGAALFVRPFGSPERLPVAGSIGPARPNAELTPGDVALQTPDVLCTDGTVDVAHPEVPAATAVAVFRNYGISDPEPHAFELDYLIGPELGGSGSVRNLWPQPYGGYWNAHLKDALEDRLHRLVCSGQLDLATAQREIAADWIGAYQKHFGTSLPLSAHATFLKDRPWPYRAGNP